MEFTICILAEKVRVPKIVTSVERNPSHYNSLRHFPYERYLCIQMQVRTNWDTNDDLSAPFCDTFDSCFRSYFNSVFFVERIFECLTIAFFNVPRASRTFAVRKKYSQYSTGKRVKYFEFRQNGNRVRSSVTKNDKLYR